MTVSISLDRADERRKSFIRNPNLRIESHQSRPLNILLWAIQVLEGDD